MKRALVLGGGGAVGIAWETGIVAGLLEDGIDVRDADLIIGTSAGSVVGSHLAHGADPRGFDGAAAPAPRITRAGRSRPRHVRRDGGIPGLGVVRGDDAGALRRNRPPGTRGRDDARRAVDRRLRGRPLARLAREAAPDDGRRLRIGEFRAFDRDSGVPIEKAVAASCAVPGLFPPVTIDGRRYTDGGVRSGTSADLAQRIEPDVVLIIAPMGARPGGIGGLIARQLAREKGELEGAGAQVRLVQLDAAALEAAGPNFLDPAYAPASADAGRAQGKRISAELRDFWHGGRRD